MIILFLLGFISLRLYYIQWLFNDYSHAMIMQWLLTYYDYTMIAYLQGLWWQLFDNEHGCEV